jgi:hypothetical protein
MFFIEAINNKTTIIGKKTIKPRSKATEFTEEQYNALKSEIDHYVENGTLRVSSPGDKDNKRKAEIIQKKLEHDTNINKDKKVLPPKSQVIQHGVDENSDKCIIIKTSGERCKSGKVSGYRVCVFHKKQVEGGKELDAIYNEKIGQYNYDEV